MILPAFRPLAADTAGTGVTPSTMEEAAVMAEAVVSILEWIFLKGILT